MQGVLAMSGKLGSMWGIDAKTISADQFYEHMNDDIAKVLAKQEEKQDLILSRTSGLNKIEQSLAMMATQFQSMNVGISNMNKKVELCESGMAEMGTKVDEAIKRIENLENCRNSSDAGSSADSSGYRNVSSGAPTSAGSDQVTYKGSTYGNRDVRKVWVLGFSRKLGAGALFQCAKMTLEKCGMSDEQVISTDARPYTQLFTIIMKTADLALQFVHRIRDRKVSVTFNDITHCLKAHIDEDRSNRGKGNDKPMSVIETDCWRRAMEKEMLTCIEREVADYMSVGFSSWFKSKGDDGETRDERRAFWEDNRNDRQFAAFSIQRQSKDTQIVAFDIDEAELPTFDGLNVSKEKATTMRETVMARIRIDLHYDKPAASRTVASPDSNQQRDEPAAKKRKSIFAHADDPELEDCF